MTLREKLEQALETYKQDHQHPLNKACHLIGIPMILTSLPLLFLAPPIGIALFVLGWMFQFLGHAIEGKRPTFLRDPKFLLVGPFFLFEKVSGLFRSA